jgi:cytoskeleton protein RodZ
VDHVADNPPPPPPLGQLLAAERERQGLARADAAQRLHMSVWQIEALENGDYSRLAGGTFLRGFVRNYAKVLGLNAEAALTALAHTAPRGPAPGIVVPTQNIRFDPIGERLTSPYVKAWGLAGVVVALTFAAMYWWLFIRPAPPAATLVKRESEHQPIPRNLAAAPVAAPEVVAPRDAPREETPEAPKPMPARVDPAKVEPKAESPRPAKPPDVVNVSAIVAAQAARPVPGARTVRLRFKGSSWVEIKDRSGKVLLSKLNEPGSEAEVSGRPPFQVVVGNAPDVTMLYDDREFPLEPHTKVAVARFTLD